MNETIEQHWHYNCEDCVRTLDIADTERELVVKMGLSGPEAMQQSMFRPVLYAMTKGVRIDLRARSEMAATLLNEMTLREEWFKAVLGHPLNPGSPKQMQALFYDDLKQRIIIKRDTGKPTLDDDALTTLGQREPILKPLLKKIAEFRTLGVFLRTFVNARLDEDERMRCSYNVCGTETYRLSSSKNAFDTGTNLQNVPKGGEGDEPEDLDLPNIRLLFIPDPDHTFFDLDLDRADLQVVVWEADDQGLKEALRKNIDMHCMNACDINNIRGIPYDELAETHPNYRNHRGRIGEVARQKAKQGVHAVDYGCKGRTLAMHFGSTVHEAEKFIGAWMGAHPGIEKWHRRTEAQLAKTRSVTNKFGYRRYYFDRPEGLLPEALAWVPQSTVAIVINKIWKALYDTLTSVQVLLQVHDSLAGQIPTSQVQSTLPLMRAASQIVIPYNEPLVIPVGIKLSNQSWGACV